jgi:signal transduction histidine kinase
LSSPAGTKNPLAIVATAAFLITAWVITAMVARVRKLTEAQLRLRFEERLAERTRIARELHDTLLQSFQGLMLHFQAVNDLLPAGKAKEALEKALDRADQAIVEGRDAIQNLRSSTTVANELGQAMASLGEEFGGARDGKGGSPTLRVSMEGTPRELHPILRDDIYRIAREALRNAFLHAQASKIEADITYDARLLRLRIRDDGKGIDPKLLAAGRDGHWGLAGMRERAEQIGAKLDIWSEVGAGTEVELCVPGSVAYGAEGSRR